MDKRIKTLGICYIVYSVIIIILVPILAYFVIGFAMFVNAEPIMNLAAKINVLIILFAGACLIGGAGLLNYKLWARKMCIILGCVNLLIVPLGTILGISTFLILTSPDMKEFFISRADVT